VSSGGPGRRGWSSEWLGPAGDLGGRPRQRLEEWLRDAIRDGRLPPGAQLPSSRALAAELGLARGTVAEAFTQLTAEGWLVSMPRSGTVVADLRGGGEPADSDGASDTARTPPPAVDTVVRHDLRPGVVDPAAFPRAAWLTASRAALGSAAADAFGTTDAPGVDALRQRLVAYLAQARGVRADAAHVVVTTGLTQSLALLGGVLDGPFAVEDPCPPGHRDVLRAASGRAPAPCAVDEHGIAVDALRAGDARAVLLTPARQRPLGVPLRPRRRTALLRWAEARDGYLVEDDQDGEFRYDRPPVGALQGLRPARVAYAGSVRAVLGPAVRVGWLVLPDALLAPVLDRLRLTAGPVSVPDQLTLAELLRSGAYQRLVRAARLRQRRRGDQLLRLLARGAPWVRPSGVPGGTVLALRLPGGHRERDVLDAARARGLAVHGLAADGYHAPGVADAGVATRLVDIAAPAAADPGAVDALLALLRAFPPR
jgi:GntR family transcriptional regulator/MocR family aminotransferase